MTDTERKSVHLMQWAVMVARQERKPMYEALTDCAKYMRCSQTVFTGAAIMLGLQKS